ncbi:hypothetical protein BDR04DRAFT_1164798 [Suillus decipiens]|nr:hypothetical protein BDR04DRAFT_1164798 [Suillus decipiens]
MVKLGFVVAPGAQSPMAFERVFAELIKGSRLSLVSAPPTEGISTLRSHLSGPAYEDDGGTSSDEEDQGNNDVVEEGEVEDEELQLSSLYLSPYLLQDQIKWKFRDSTSHGDSLQPPASLSFFSDSLPAPGRGA